MFLSLDARFYEFLSNKESERYTSSGDLAIAKVSVANPGLVSYNLFSFTLTSRF